MTSPRRNHVGKEEDVIENALCAQTQRAEPDGRLTYGHECHQVHSFVFCFFQQGMYPARITLHQAKRAKVPEGCRNHARNGSSRFEEDDPLVKPIESSHGTGFEIGGDLQRAIGPDPLYIRLRVIVGGSWRNWVESLCAYTGKRNQTPICMWMIRGEQGW